MLICFSAQTTHPSHSLEGECCSSHGHPPCAQLTLPAYYPSWVMSRPAASSCLVISRHIFGLTRVFTGRYQTPRGVLFGLLNPRVADTALISDILANILLKNILQKCFSLKNIFLSTNSNNTTIIPITTSNAHTIITPTTNIPALIPIPVIPSARLIPTKNNPAIIKTRKITYTIYKLQQQMVIPHCYILAIVVHITQP